MRVNVETEGEGETEGPPVALAEPLQGVHCITQLFVRTPLPKFRHRDPVLHTFAHDMDLVRVLRLVTAGAQILGDLISKSCVSTRINKYMEEFCVAVLDGPRQRGTTALHKCHAARAEMMQLTVSRM